MLVTMFSVRKDVELKLKFGSDAGCPKDSSRVEFDIQRLYPFSFHYYVPCDAFPPLPFGFLRLFGFFAVFISF